MLIKFGFRNFYSFKEESCISFELDKNVPLEISNGLENATVMGIKGANSSGKTNIIKALTFISKFVTSSSKKDDYKIVNSSFFNSKENTRLFAEFRISDTFYKYEIELNANKVVSESVFRKQKKWTPILTRHGSDITTTIKATEKAKDIKISENASVISTLSNFKVFDELNDLRKIYEFFSTIAGNVSTKQGMQHLSHNFKEITALHKKYPETFEFVKEFLKKSDPSIIDIRIVEDTDKDGELQFIPVFTHGCGEKSMDLQFKDESSGTKSLYMTLGTYNATILLGGVLAIDEFDIHLHAMLLPHILELFTNKDLNKRNAQFIFTAHNTEIIDTLGRYRTILVNKEDCESYCYRLDEIGGQILRNDRPISPVYNKGLIGGTPNL